MPLINERFFADDTGGHAVGEWTEMLESCVSSPGNNYIKKIHADQMKMCKQNCLKKASNAFSVILVFFFGHNLLY